MTIMRHQIFQSMAAISLLVLSLGLAAATPAQAAQGNAASPHTAPKPQAVAADPVARCAALIRVDLSTTQEAPAEILASAAHEGKGDVPAYCEVSGYVWRNTQFQIRFPLANWNSRYVVMGTGGQAGQIRADIPLAPYSVQGDHLRRGFAVIDYNGGHTSTSGDAKWAYDNESAMIDYGFRSAHVANITGRAILSIFFGRAPVHAYFRGCSNGGREALMMAQRYPYDFDGIIAGAPSIRYGDIFINAFWLGSMLKSPAGLAFDDAAVATLHRSVVNQCGIRAAGAGSEAIDPRSCKVDVSRTICKSGEHSDCLTVEQADFARTLYSGPRRADGTPIVKSSIMPGSELSWPALRRRTNNYPADVFRYLAFSPAPGPNWSPDVARLDDYQKRMGTMEGLFNATNPDIRIFKARGGRLIMYFGWADVIGGIGEGIDYYEMVNKLMGGSVETMKFARLFLIPGMDHCLAGGEGPSVFDFTGVIDNWVINGKAPSTLNGYHPNPDGSPSFYRTVPVYAVH
jgi:feruloyl esterase